MGVEGKCGEPKQSRGVTHCATVSATKIKLVDPSAGCAD
jgi:hypothetical protein